MAGALALAAALAPAAGGMNAARGRTTIVVRTSAEFRTALGRATPGTTIALAPGVYQGGISASGIAGASGAPIAIVAADPDNRPVVRGGSTGLQLTRVRHVTVRHLVFEGQRANGINVDDGGTSDTPSAHVTLSEVTLRDLDGPGITAAIKFSGVEDFVVERSTVTNWGSGSAITMIGAHRGLIQGTLFRHRDDRGATGPQMKGGSTGIVVRANRFEHAGLRAVQIGGSAGAQFFRPQPPASYEARDCTVEHNVFIGSESAVAFVNVDGSTFRHNTVYRPRKWLVRILQEVRTPGFVPSRRGVVSGNLIYYEGSDFPFGAVNVGDGTDAPSFRFARNWWYRADRPAESRPGLPTGETDGVYGRNPLFVDGPAGDLRLAAGSQAAAYGASADVLALAGPGGARR